VATAGTRHAARAIAVLSEYFSGSGLLLRADVARSQAREDAGHAQELPQRGCDRSYRAGCRRGCASARCPLVPGRRPSALCVCRYDMPACRRHNHGLRERLPRAEQLPDTRGFADFAQALPDHMQSPRRPLHRDGLLPRAARHTHLDAVLGGHINSRRHSPVNPSRTRSHTVTSGSGDGRRNGRALDSCGAVVLIFAFAVSTRGRQKRAAQRRDRPPVEVNHRMRERPRQSAASTVHATQRTPPSRAGQMLRT